MKWLFIAIFYISMLSSISCDEIQKKRITVALSERRPFVTVDENKLGGLDVSIIENFAKKLKLEVNYVQINESLNLVFDKDGFNQTKIRNMLRYRSLN